MKALLSIAPGGPQTLILGTLPDPPAPGPHMVRLRIKACALNFPDVLVIEDKYQYRPERPFAPGYEVSGLIDAVGDGVDDLAVGDRVIAYASGGGGLAELVNVPADRCVRMPDDRPFEEAAGLLFTGATVYHALCGRADLKPGESMLVMGAGGGVGLAAVELGSVLGARVVAAASSPEKLEIARSRGAGETVLYPAGALEPEAARAFGGQLKASAGAGGFDIVLDPVGGAHAEAALRALGWRGRYLVVGFTGGIPRIPLNLVLLKEADLLGVAWGAFAEREPALDRRNLEAVAGLYREGLLRPHVGACFALHDAKEAIAMLAERRAVGKVVVTIS